MKKYVNAGCYESRIVVLMIRLRILDGTYSSLSSSVKCSSIKFKALKWLNKIYFGNSTAAKVKELSNDMLSEYH